MLQTLSWQEWAGVVAVGGVLGYGTARASMGPDAPSSTVNQAALLLGGMYVFGVAIGANKEQWPQLTKKD
jgi:hypothetical protein